MFATDRRAYQMDWEDQPGAAFNSPINDPLNNTQFGLFNQDTKGRVPLFNGMMTGRVIESFPYLNACRVNCGARGVYICNYGTHSSNVPWGPSASLSYAPGQNVLIYLPENAQHAIIICAIPDPVNEPNNWRPDAIFSGSNVGYFLDETSNFWTGQSYNENVDFSGGRPYDTTSAPEHASQGVTGVGIFHDDFMFAVKVDEATGVFGFYDDSMLRVAGRNLQIWGYGNEKQWLNDEGELNGYSGHTPFAWEANGAYFPGVTTSLALGEVAAAGDQESESENNATGVDNGLEGIKNGFIQPMSYDQQPFHRIVSYSGYLGQGGRKMVIAPGEEILENSQLVNSFNQDAKWRTLFSQQVSLTGDMVTCTSGNFMVVKRPPMPTPKRKELPESTLGDNNDFTWRYPKNYDACGLPVVGENGELGQPTHAVTGDIPVDYPTDGGVPTAPGPETITAPEAVLRSAAIADELAYMTSWEGVHPFHYHSKDFFLPEESDFPEFIGERPPYEGLGSFQYLGEQGDDSYPKSAGVYIDPRYGSVTVYLNTAYFGLKKDGSFAMRTGCGCEIKSENGTLKLIAPGDVVIQSGRNTVSLAGHDTILKSRNSVDIASTETDVRVSAAKNLMMASAIEDDGVMLFESFSTCVVDEEYENTIYPEDEEPPVDEPPVEDPLPEDLLEEEEDPPGPSFLLGEDVIGSGIVFKARRAQVTTSSAVATIKVGQKLYREEAGDGADGFEPITEIDPETGKLKDRQWTWKPGKIRLIAEMGQVDCFASYIVDYVTPKNDFSTDEPAESEEDQSGAIYQVFLRAEQPETDEEEEDLEVENLPPNILAAAGTADLSSTNTCGDETSTGNCYRVISVNESRIGRATFCADLLVNKEFLVGGCAYIRGKLAVFDQIQSNFPLQTANGGLNAQRADIVAVFDEADTRCHQLLPPIMAEQANLLLTDPNGEWLNFSHRTPEQYGTSNQFCIMESWWQHQIRKESEGENASNDDFPALPTGTVFWKEKPMEVLYANVEKVAPFPGAAYIKDEEEDEEESTEVKNCYGIFDLKMVDEETGQSIDRSAVENPDDEDSPKIFEFPKLDPGKMWRLSHYIAVDVQS